MWVACLALARRENLVTMISHHPLKSSRMTFEDETHQANNERSRYFFRASNRASPFLRL